MAASSKALLRSRVAPKLLHRFSASNANRAVELWTTTCIVTNFGRRIAFPYHHHDTDADADAEALRVDSSNSSRSSSCRSVLINPSNASLSGCRNFPYFPRGGPVPAQPVTSRVHKDWQPLGYVSQWGGMEVGTGMLYPASVVDGLVHQTGGWQLQAELQWMRLKKKVTSTSTISSEAGYGDCCCPVGTAVTTSAGNGPLNQQYDGIVHTTPPFYKFDADPELQLARCYQSAMQRAFDDSSSHGDARMIRAAVPLLGSGARGFPVHVACQVAAESMVQWLLQQQQQQNTTANTDGISSIRHYSSDAAEEHLTEAKQHVVAFGLLEESVAGQLASAILDRMENMSAC